jgi:hypothetical protein
MGNIYNVEQKVVPTSVAGTDQGTKSGLDAWKSAIRKELMEKLKHYSPEQAEKIINATFGDMNVMS